MKPARILAILLIQLTSAIAISISSNNQSASALLKSLVTNEKCFTSTSGAQLFADSCATNVIYEDCYHPQPFVGRRNVQQYLMDKVDTRKSKGEIRLDRITDGDGTRACGFAWTYTCGEEEGLRGTTFVELNNQGEIQYVREIPEPIFKPGDLTLELLKAVTAGAEKQVLPDYTPRSPKDANDIVKYLFNEVQGRDIEIAMDFFSEDIVYRDFNYEEALKGKDEVRKFIEDFSFPGIEFRAQRFDDGVLSTCFTWEVVLMDAPDTVKGISFYELDPVDRRITYVRDVPESAIKPPILGKIARQLRPGLGVFQGVRIGSRPGGM